MSRQKAKKGKDNQRQTEYSDSREQEGNIALVLQGGGGMGAYEVGAVKAIIEHAVENDKKADSNFFNIIAGSSIGAINGAILVQEFVKGRSWSNAIHELENFWLNQLATDTSVVDNTPGFCEWWESMYNSLGNSDVIAKCEAARRYYSSVQFWLYGIPDIFSSSTKYDNRFLDPSFNYLQRGDWSPLGDKLENYKREKGFQFFPIKTNPTKNEPRLLTTTIDVKTGSAVTFDSYSEESSYALKTGDTANKNTNINNNNNPEITIKYPNGLMREHIMASAAIPANRDFTVVKDINSIQHMYWDGAFASNTPLRGLIQSHRDWYLNHYAKEGAAAEGEGITVPDLKEIYIIDLWPRTLEEKDRLPIPPDNNFVWSRMWDLLFDDKTTYVEKTSEMITDYLDIIEMLLPLAEQNGHKEEVEKFLSEAAHSRHRDGRPRQRKELLEGRFKIDKIHRIKMKAFQDASALKIFDFSRKTIEQLLDQGYNDAIAYFSSSAASQK